MHRDPLLRAIRRYADRYPEEARTTERFSRFVEANEDCFERSLAIGHVTGASWIVNETGDQVLLTHHAKLDIWIQPGGHADGDSDVLAVARKEAQEETGLDPIALVTSEIFDLDIHDIPARKEIPAHEHFDVRFAFRHSGDGQFVVTEESHDLAWVPVAELSRYTDESSIHRMARKWNDYLASAPTEALPVRHETGDCSEPFS